MNDEIITTILLSSSVFRKCQIIVIRNRNLIIIIRKSCWFVYFRRYHKYFLNIYSLYTYFFVPIMTCLCCILKFHSFILINIFQSGKHFSAYQTQTIFYAYSVNSDQIISYSWAFGFQNNSFVISQEIQTSVNVINYIH